MSDEKQPAEAGIASEAAEAQVSRLRDVEEQVARLEARTAELAQCIEEKQQKLASCEKETREYLDGWQRERANFENFRKRMAREMDDAGIIAKVDLIRRVLPAIDNLERALGDVTTDAEVVRRGVRMTHDQLLAALEQEGLKLVPSTGHPFDPNVHEAVDAVAGTEHAADTVVEDLQKGYTFSERLVRPARVRVAR